MSESQTEALRALQARLAQDAATVRTREDYYRLQMYYGDIQRVLDSEDQTE